MARDLFDQRAAASCDARHADRFDPGERGSDWRRAPFTGDSKGHVSVWQKATLAA